VSFQELVQVFGLPGAMLVTALLLLYYDKVVSGTRYRRVLRERDSLLRLVLNSQQKTATAADMVEALTEPVRKRESDEGD
jgi:hypothetical protein